MSANQRGPENADASVAALFAVDPTAVKIGKEIGKGAFSVVYSGEYNKKHVAVKCQPKDEEGNIPQFVLKEVQILQKLRHPNILEFIGAADNRKTRQILILSEHSSHGDLDQLLKNIRQEKVKHVGWQKVTEMALDVARGVAFLHASGMIHRDIKSSNILLDDRMRAKLCDFGFATETKWWYETSSTGEQPETSGVVRRKSYCGTDAYMAPEMFLDEDYDETVDVFSFGVVLMELLCCRQANKDGFLMRLPQHKFKIQENEFRDALPASCPAVLSDLAEQCVSFEPSERPKSVDVVKVLTEAISSKDRCDKFEKVIELRPFTPTTSLDLAEGEPQLEDDDEDDDDEEEEDEDFRDDDSGADTMELDEEEDAQEHPPVVPPPRHSGPLLKRNRRGNRGWSEKMFIIDQDYLHYTDIPKERNTGSNGRRLSQPSPPTMSSLYLKDCRIWKTMEMPELCFNILNGSWKIKRELRALNLDDLEKWMILINQAIDFANDQALSRQSASKPLHAKGKAHNNGSSGSRERGGSRGSRGKTKHAEERRPEALTKKQGDDAEDTYEDLNDEVYQWLRELGLQRYTGTLKTKGFSSLEL